jgi:hypothetical protein
MRVQFAGGSVVALLITVGVVLTSVTGCSEPPAEEERGHTASDFVRIGPGRNQLPPAPRIAGPPEHKDDPCDVPRGDDRGDGCPATQAMPTRPPRRAIQGKTPTVLPAVSGADGSGTRRQTPKWRNTAGRRRAG